jgi:AcrR family transcriptional regulator
MPVSSRAGKAPRTYDATGRQARARALHERTLERSRELFFEHGYVATTVGAIASAADVSPATIYKTYGGKAGLVRELCARALAGVGPTPAHERSDALRGHEDARGLVDGWGALLAEVSPRFSPLLILLRTAADTDDEAAALYAELDEDRLARMTENANFLADNGHLRDGVTREHARDVMWFCSSAEFYELLVVRRGWSAEQLGRFASGTMAAALL